MVAVRDVHSTRESILSFCFLLSDSSKTYQTKALFLTLIEIHVEYH